jgi:hypothetical protein
MVEYMRYGYRYTNENADEDEYRFAEPVEYADGAWLGDCWLVDEHGGVHPGYNVSPVPILAKNLTDPVKVEQR